MATACDAIVEQLPAAKASVVRTLIATGSIQLLVTYTGSLTLSCTPTQTGANTWLQIDGASTWDVTDGGQWELA